MSVERKRAIRELQRQVYDLECTLRALRRGQTTQLPWEDVALALKDDFLSLVTDHRTLKQRLEDQRQLLAHMHTWVHRNLRTASDDPYAASYLLRGSTASREMAFAWLIRQQYAQTFAVMDQQFYPLDPRAEHVDIGYSLGDTTSDTNAFALHVTTQMLLPYALPTATAGVFEAERSFTAVFRTADNARSHASRDLCVRGHDVSYTHEAMALSRDAVIANTVLLGRVNASATRTILVLRTISHDDAYPIAPRTWRSPVLQWTVLDALDATTTRCRTYYFADSLWRGATRVPLQRLGARFNVDLRQPDGLHRLCEANRRFQLNQRAFFRAHLDATLRRVAHDT
ncbi:hypothetical protein SDRG_16477 [Saprolegnia diclina VS20]|uniref:START domain-containing protein n=1 Tax=Saprolegnia diclina (strain VS20) TaxID=1156394 RepID=T0PTU4_SAPDV|nr:hypothetical protein SDRG_16477 [Saprolegnia diclina VS20]EQC25656.1 hypothetical protein SDRG_16477 [Saprolegnia diclina VS20]|eukprot:XP_008620913.1 hypothetical protein SDRG_16477 [Saprolegnia diclina VS20]